MAERGKTYHASALVLEQTKLKETDAILTLLMRSGAQIRAVAKGARKPGGKLAGKVRLFSSIDGLFARGKNLDILVDARLRDESFFLSGDLVVLAAASAIASIARLCSYQDVEDPFLWGATQRVLCALQPEEEGPDAAAAVALRFTGAQTPPLLVATHTFKVLSHSGWHPRGLPKPQSLDEALSQVRTLLHTAHGKSVSSEPVRGEAFPLDTSGTEASACPHALYFSAEGGGFFSTEALPASTSSVRVSAIFAPLVSFLINAPYADIESSHVAEALTLQDVQTLLQIAHAWAAFNLDARLKSFEYLEKLL